MKGSDWMFMIGNTVHHPPDPEPTGGARFLRSKERLKFGGEVSLKGSHFKASHLALRVPENLSS